MQLCSTDFIKFIDSTPQLKLQSGEHSFQLACYLFIKEPLILFELNKLFGLLMRLRQIIAQVASNIIIGQPKIVGSFVAVNYSLTKSQVNSLIKLTFWPEYHWRMTTDGRDEPSVICLAAAVFEKLGAYSRLIKQFDSDSVTEAPVGNYYFIEDRRCSVLVLAPKNYYT